jgi:dihydroxyacetone kinase-like predicted kinase
MENITIEELLLRIVDGAQAVINKKELINEINVFPVPDADTGSNMAATLTGVKKAIEGNLDINGVLNSALISSQGNSGIMTTAFLSGFLNKIKNQKVITGQDLKKSFKEGYLSAASSVENPKKGTMLDVMEAFSNSIENSDVVNSLNLTQDALKKTEENMDVLSKNHVVDAGALGFTIFLFAFFEKEFDISQIDIHKVEIQKISFGNFPYEVVFIAADCAFSKLQLEDMFHPLGESIDIVEVEKKIKLHIHTNEPELVNQTAQLLGKIESINTVDMRIEGGHN